MAGLEHETETTPTASTATESQGESVFNTEAHAIVLHAISALGIVSNTIIILLFVCYKSMRQNAELAVLFYLAICDLTVVTSPISDRFIQWFIPYPSTFVCLLAGFQLAAGICTTEIMAMYICYDRLKGLRNPQLYEGLPHWRRATTCFGIAVLFAVVLHSSHFWMREDLSVPVRSCTDVVWVDVYINLSLIYNVLSGVLLVSLCGRVVFVAIQIGHQQRKAEQAQQHAQNHALFTISNNNPAAPATAEGLYERTKQAKLTMFLSKILVMYILFYATPSLATLIMQATGASLTMLEYSFAFLVYGLMLNSSVNLFLFIKDSPEFETHTMKLLMCSCQQH